MHNPSVVLLIIVAVAAVVLYLFPASRPAVAVSVGWGLRTVRRIVGGVGSLLEIPRRYTPLGFYVWATLNIASYVLVWLPYAALPWSSALQRGSYLWSLVVCLAAINVFVVLGFLLRLIEEDAFTDGAIGDNELWLQNAGVLRSFSTFGLCCAGVVLQTANAVLLLEHWLGQSLFSGKPSTGIPAVDPLLTAASLFPIVQWVVASLFGTKILEANAWGGSLYGATWFLGNTVMVAGTMAFFQQRQNLTALLDRLPVVPSEEAHYLQIRASRSGNFLKHLLEERLFSTPSLNKRLLQVGRFARLFNFPQRFLAAKNYSTYPRETRSIGRYVIGEFVKSSADRFSFAHRRQIVASLLESFEDLKTFKENAAELTKERRELLEILVLVLDHLRQDGQLSRLRDELGSQRWEALRKLAMLIAVAHTDAKCRAMGFAIVEPALEGRLYVKLVMLRFPSYATDETRMEMLQRVMQWSSAHWANLRYTDLKTLHAQTTRFAASTPDLQKLIDAWRADLAAQMQTRGATAGAKAA
jgi:hypothetical protein